MFYFTIKFTLQLLETPDHNCNTVAVDTVYGSRALFLYFIDVKLTPVPQKELNYVDSMMT